MKNFGTTAIATVMILFSTLGFSEVRTMPVQETAGIRVKATWYQGSLIPVADLPEMEIIDSPSTAKLLPASVENGEMTVHASLPEVEITAADPENDRVPVVYQQGVPVATVYLPVVEISEELPKEHMIPVAFVNGEPVAVQNLETVEIVADNNTLTANWDVKVQSNPEIMVAHTQSGQFFLMEYKGRITDQQDREVFIYRIISGVKGILSEGVYGLLRSVGAN